MIKTSIKGNAYYGKVTKQLLHEIPPHSIIIIEHEDLDLMATEDMVRKNVKAVINTKPSITGNLPRSGVIHLMNNNIPVFDLHSLHDEFRTRMYLKVDKNKLLIYDNEQWKVIGSLKSYTRKMVEEKREEGKNNFPHLFSQFAENSFQHASNELDIFINAVKTLPRLKELQGENTFVVARGTNVDQDIRILRPAIFQKKCKVIAVDGAASFLINEDILPDYIVGDMDSVPKEIIKMPIRFISHSYMNGESPGQKRLQHLKVDSTALPFPGLSEDLAIMLAFVSEAEHIYTLGCRNSTAELVEKGRKGMGSTLLTRMYSGDKITDCKSLCKLLSTFDQGNRSNRLLAKEAISFNNYLKEY